MENEKNKDMSAELTDAVYRALPAEFGGHRLDAEFNDDGTVTLLVGSDEYAMEIKRIV